MAGKTIRLFLVNGTPTGLIAAEVLNWTGKVYFVPRAQLPELKKREETQGAGVYMLIGPDPDVAGRLKVYIGESDHVIDRVAQHDRSENKDFYDQAVLLISKDDNLTKAHAKYIEMRLIALAKANGSATLTNDTRGSLDVSLPESDIADMEAYVEQVQIVLPVLGCVFTQPKVNAALAAKALAKAASVDGDGEAIVSPLFTLSAVGALAHGKQVGGQFFLLSGSTTRKQGVNAWTAYKGLRDQLVAENKLVQDPTDPARYIVPEDIALSSPSAAATVVAARNMNGRKMWRIDDTGETYQDWFDKQLPPATVAGGS